MPPKSEKQLSDAPPKKEDAAALAKVLEILEPLSGNGRARVLASAAAYFDLDLS